MQNKITHFFHFPSHTFAIHQVEIDLTDTVQPLLILRCSFVVSLNLVYYSIIHPWHICFLIPLLCTHCNKAVKLKMNRHQKEETVAKQQPLCITIATTKTLTVVYSFMIFPKHTFPCTPILSTHSPLYLLTVSLCLSPLVLFSIWCLCLSIAFLPFYLLFCFFFQPCHSFKWLHLV